MTEHPDVPESGSSLCLLQQYTWVIECCHGCYMLCALTGACGAKEAAASFGCTYHWRGAKRDGVHPAGSQGGAPLPAPRPHGSSGIDT